MIYYHALVLVSMKYLVLPMQQYWWYISRGLFSINGFGNPIQFLMLWEKVITVALGLYLLPVPCLLLMVALMKV